MSGSNGAPPKAGWVGLAPELLVQDFHTSLDFWCGLLGFEIAYQRAEDAFAYLEHRDGAQIMLCERYGEWETGALTPPFGRGVMFQIHVSDVEARFAQAHVSP